MDQQTTQGNADLLNNFKLYKIVTLKSCKCEYIRFSSNLWQIYRHLYCQCYWFKEVLRKIRSKYDVNSNHWCHQLFFSAILSEWYWILIFSCKPVYGHRDSVSWKSFQVSFLSRFCSNFPFSVLTVQCEKGDVLFCSLWLKPIEI